MVLRILAAIAGIGMGVNALHWLIAPSSAAQQLDMTLLNEGLARSTMVGDFTAFFASATVMIFMGLFTSNATWLRAAALLLGCAALFRTFAWVAHGAALSVKYIGIEIILAVVLLLAAAQIAGAAQKSGS